MKEGEKMKIDNRKLAEEILAHVGGEENVNSLIHCVTRLRFKLKDEGKADTEYIKNLEGVMTVIKSGGQYQVVIGDTVSDVYKEVLAISSIDSAARLEVNEDQGNGKKDSLFSKMVNLLSSLFTPVLGVMAASGILKGLVVLLTTLNILSPDQGTHVILSAAGDAMFYFLPVILGFSAGKVFGTNQYLAATLGAVLVYPTLVASFNDGINLTFTKIPVVMINYTSSLIPIVVAVWILAHLEKQLKKIVPNALKMMMIPLICLVIIVPFTLLVVGPISTSFGVVLAKIMMVLYSFNPWISGLVLASVWQGAVLLGLHWAFIPIFFNNIATQGFDQINAMLYCTIFAQTGAALVVALKSRNVKDKSLAYSATISGFLGITEPIIYGVTLPKKKPFIAASVASGIGGMIAGGFGARMYGGFASGGIFGIPMFINPSGIDNGFIGFCLSIAVAFVCGFIFTWFVYKDYSVNSYENKITQKIAKEG